VSFRKGREAIVESVAKGQGGNNFPETHWVSWKAGETKVLRFLTDIDDVLVVSMHSMVDTHDGKKANFVCRTVFDDPCELCQKDVYKRDSGYGVAVVRQPVYEDGKIVGYEDQVLEYDEETPNGIVRKKKPVVGIVNQAMRNFWNTVALVHEKYGDLRTFDIEIARQGGGTDTTYIPFPLPPKTIENMEERYKDFTPDLEGFLTRIGSQAYYDNRLHGIQAEKKDEVGNFNSGVGQSYNSPPVVTTPTVSGDYLEEQTTADRLRAKLESNPYG